MRPLARLHRAWTQYRALFLFAGGLFLLDCLIGQFASVWERYSPDDYLARIEGCRTCRPDLLVIGGSPVSEGIDPSHFVGLRWKGQGIERPYALGLPGGTASEFHHAMKRVSEHPPRLLIYGCTASDWNDRRHEPMGPNSLMTWSELGGWIVDRPESAEWVTRHFLQSRLAQSWDLFQYRRGIRLWVADQFPDAFPDAASEARDGLTYSAALREGNGYAPNPKYVHARYEHDAPPTIPHLRNYTLGAHLRYLGRTLDWCREQGVDVIFVDMPVTRDLDVRMHPAEFERFRTTLHELATERGYPILCATREEVGVDDEDFADVIHLNGTGATKLSRWVRTRLEAAR